MPDPLAYLNGQFVPRHQLSVSVDDVGFMLGVTVSERLRTFHGQLFRLPRHLERLDRSLAIVGIDIGLNHQELTEIAERLVGEHRRQLADGDDVGLVLFASPGVPGSPSHSAATNPETTLPATAQASAAQDATAPSSASAEVPAPTPAPRPTVCLYTDPLPFHQWADLYESGQPLAIVDVRQVPTNCWPAELKCRSRMHYYLADREAARRFPGSRAILLDQDGFVSEASTANVLIYREAEGLLAPTERNILPGVTLSVNEELAAQVDLPFTRRDLTADDLRTADEILLCSTSPCLWPALQLDGRPVGSGRPGRVFRRLLAAWNELVGVDLMAQATRFRHR